MAYKKIRYTLWLIVFTLNLVLLSGCGGPIVQLDFPLHEGNSWIYNGTISYNTGNQKQTMPPLSFKLQSYRIGKKSETPFELALFEENELLWKIQFAHSIKGLVNPLTGELWMPHEIKLRKKWTVTVAGEKVKLQLQGQASTTVPAGTFAGYIIDFKGPQNDHGSLLLDPDVGIVTLEWTSKTPGGQSTTHLELNSYDIGE